MISKNTKPNAEQKAWLKSVADFHNEYGTEYLYGEEWSCVPFQIHHVAFRLAEIPLPQDGVENG